MKKIGITGGVGSGKSRVLEYFRTLPDTAGYQADLIARELQLPGQICYQKVLDHFGRGILFRDGTIDRAILGKIVFQNPKEMSVLNGIVHPTVQEEILRLIEKEEEKGTKLFVLEAALLTEPVYRSMLDEIWYIHVPESIRRERLAASREYPGAKIDSMIASQPSEKTFTDFCDRVIENGGAFEETQAALGKALGDFDREYQNRCSGKQNAD